MGPSREWPGRARFSLRGRMSMAGLGVAALALVAGACSTSSGASSGAPVKAR